MENLFPCLTASTSYNNNNILLILIITVKSKNGVTSPRYLSLHSILVLHASPTQWTTSATADGSWELLSVCLRAGSATSRACCCGGQAAASRSPWGDVCMFGLGLKMLQCPQHQQGIQKKASPLALDLPLDAFPILPLGMKTELKKL